MDNLTTNQTNYSSPSTMLDVPGFIAFNVLMLVGCMLPVATLDISILVVLAVDKVTPGVIRFTLGNILIVGLVMLFLLTLEHLMALVLVTTDHPPPPLDFCSVILWALFGAGALRQTLTATFSIVVFIMVQKGVKAINKKALLISVIILWVVCFFTLNIPLLAIPNNNAFIEGVACLPVGEGNIVDDISAALYISVFGVIPLLIGTAMPIAIFVYIYKHRTTESSDTAFTKAMAKLSALFILGGSIIFLGQTSPAIISLAAFSAPNTPIPGLAVSYVFLTVFGLSLWPTPILILVYMKGLSARMKNLLLFLVCCRQLSVDREPSITMKTESFHQISHMRKYV